MRRDDIASVFGAINPVPFEKTMETLDLSHLMKEAGEAIVYIDSNWVVKYCNDVYLANIGLPRHEIVGRRPFDYEPSFRRSIFYDCIVKCLKERKPTSQIGYSTMLDRWLMVRLFPAGSGLVMLANDASEQVVKQYQLAQQVVKDTLTGLRNKLGLIQDLEQLMQRKGDFSLSIIGLDRFRALNDALGYAGGDMGLLEIASRLQTATMAGEHLYRLNGDEFGLVRRQGVEGTAERLEALNAIIQQPLVLHGHRFVVGASSGCVAHDPDVPDAERLLKRASLALKHAKKVDRGGMVMYEPGLETASQLRAQLEGELRTAIDSQQLMLHLQPKGSLADGSLVGAEALIRWAHPKRGMVSPADFLPLANECGLMGTIDQLVLRQALHQIGELQRQGFAVPVSINLSVASLSDVCLVERVQEALRVASVEPHMLEIEIPEGALMQDVDTSANVLAGLHHLGVKISIDDFGTGYSSFAYLARFPVHALKVDRSFVKEMATNAASQKIVKGIVRMAHSLQLKVIAEGAEGREEMELLSKIRCDMVQGFGYGRPMALNPFVNFARQNAGKSKMSAFTL